MKYECVAYGTIECVCVQITESYKTRRNLLTRTRQLAHTESVIKRHPRAHLHDRPSMLPPRALTARPRSRAPGGREGHDDDEVEEVARVEEAGLGVQHAGR